MNMARLFILLLIIFAAGCSQPQPPLVVGTNASFPPFEYLGGADGKTVVGLDIDLIRSIAKQMDREVQIQNMEFDQLMDALLTGQIDVIASGMSITPERQAKVNFSDPYYKATQVVIVNVDNNQIHSVSDLTGKRIAVQKGATGDKLANRYSQSVLAFESAKQAIQALKLGKADLILYDIEPAANFVGDNSSIKLVTLPFSPEYYGFAVHKNNFALINTINQSLSNMKEAGQYQAILAKHIK
ncbi:basic amino acid ABC transporter substrate-binding protein [Shewanella sp. NIFS-20-20]|uniref:basic amino acid ABC transporter substrate-binding protein n=1 Tax=Shewanella sp. NIFS-20-20 TaxID=2853806 RepID=UPI001C4728E5|nr:basic amino acid ABC transporter substrate-binding protein [Shewanella sp. NIFS-20-20]MBV7317184.1 basic amino acid ABC transporter substrate-binding protein [Shewanella sp. NIFS-20-20]